jgi:hypothetical protein
VSTHIQTSFVKRQGGGAAAKGALAASTAGRPLSSGADFSEAWPSCAAYLTAVAESLERGTPFGPWRPEVIRGGELWWDLTTASPGCGKPTVRVGRTAQTRASGSGSVGAHFFGRSTAMALRIKHWLRHAALVAGAGLALVVATSATAHAAGSFTEQITDCFGNVHYKYQVIYARGGMQTNGTSGDDVIIGSDDIDFIDGLGGRDVICGGDGGDEIHGGDDEGDFIDGENGKDWLRGGDGADVVRGGALDDYIDGEDGDDTIYGGPGDDTIYGSYGIDTIQCDDGDDFASGAWDEVDEFDSFSGIPGNHGGCERYENIP